MSSRVELEGDFAERFTARLFPDRDADGDTFRGIAAAGRGEAVLNEPDPYCNGEGCGNCIELPGASLATA